MTALLLWSSVLTPISDSVFLLLRLVIICPSTWDCKRTRTLKSNPSWPYTHSHCAAAFWGWDNTTSISTILSTNMRWPSSEQMLRPTASTWRITLLWPRATPDVAGTCWIRKWLSKLRQWSYLQNHVNYWSESTLVKGIVGSLSCLNQLQAILFKFLG